MKNLRNIFLISGLMFLVSVVFIACGDNVTGGTEYSSNLFYNNTSSTTPVFEPSSSLASSVIALTSSWESGNPLYSVYFTLREFLASRDEGVVDRSNLYKLLIDVDTVYSALTSAVGTITEQTIISPFSQLPSIECNRLVNDSTNQRAGALKETTEEVDAIVTWIWTTGSTQEEYGIATLNYNKLTGDVTVEMTFSVDYNLATTATDYNLRCWVTGNTTTNTFKFKYIIGDMKIVAEGVSRGAGNYMLFKYSSGEAVNYMVVPGDADEDFFIAQNTSPTNIYTDPTSLPASVEAYKDWVLGTTFFTSSNLLTDTSNLNSGNPQAGTIYLDYD